ncbi:unnamed protein product, partial [Mesorhabditis spiculigera]
MSNTKLTSSQSTTSQSEPPQPSPLTVDPANPQEQTLGFRITPPLEDDDTMRNVKSLENEDSGRESGIVIDIKCSTTQVTKPSPK